MLNETLCEALHAKLQLEQNRKYNKAESNFIYTARKDMFYSIGLIKAIPYSFAEQGRIYMHEKIYGKASKRIYNDFLKTGVQKKPIMLFHDHLDLNQILRNELQSAEILHSALNRDGFQEVVQAIQHQTTIDSIEKELSKIKCFCVADGHHRLSALLNYYKSNVEISPDMRKIYSGVFYSSDVKTLGQSIVIEIPFQQIPSFMMRAEKLCRISKVTSPSYSACSNKFLMHTKGEWYEFDFIEKIEDRDLNKVLFNRHFLKKISNLPLKKIKENLTVFDLQTYRPSNYGINESNTITFFLAPDDPLTVFELAKEGYRSEQHSTCFIPKLPDYIMEFQLANSTTNSIHVDKVEVS